MNAVTNARGTIDVVPNTASAAAKTIRPPLVVVARSCADRNEPIDSAPPAAPRANEAKSRLKRHPVSPRCCSASRGIW